MVDCRRVTEPHLIVVNRTGGNGSAVDHLGSAVTGGGDGVHQPVPNTCLPPSHEAVVADGARTIALGQIAPWRSGSQHPEDAIQHTAIFNARYTSRLLGKSGSITRHPKEAASPRSAQCLSLIRRPVHHTVNKIMRSQKR